VQAHDLFVELDDDNSGAVSYAEISETLKSRLGSVTEGAKHLLTTLAFHDAHSWNKTQQIDKNGIAEVAKAWGGKLEGPDADSFRQQIQAQLQSSAMNDSDLYNLLVTPLVRGDATRPLTKEVFIEGFRRLGYKGPLGMLQTLYKRCDRDRSGVIGFTELHNWMTGKMDRANLARRVHLLWGRSDGLTLERMTWSPDGLRRELVSMLRRTDLAPLDLVRAWDQSQDCTFDAVEFRTMMKKIALTHVLADDSNAGAVAVAKAKPAASATANGEAAGSWQVGKASAFPSANQQADGAGAAAGWLVSMMADKALAEHLENAATKVQAIYRGRMMRQKAKMTRVEADAIWNDKIKPAVVAAFDQIAGRDRSVDVEEFVRWINEEWRRQKQASDGAKDENKPKPAMESASDAEASRQLAEAGDADNVNKQQDADDNTKERVAPAAQVALQVDEYVVETAASHDADAKQPINFVTLDELYCSRLDRVSSYAPRSAGESALLWPRDERLSRSLDRSRAEAAKAHGLRLGACWGSSPCSSSKSSPIKSPPRTRKQQQQHRTEGQLASQPPELVPLAMESKPVHRATLMRGGRRSAGCLTTPPAGRSPIVAPVTSPLPSSPSAGSVGRRGGMGGVDDLDQTVLDALAIIDVEVAHRLAESQKRLEVAMGCSAVAMDDTTMLHEASSSAPLMRRQRQALQTRRTLLAARDSKGQRPASAFA